MTTAFLHYTTQRKKKKQEEETGRSYTAHIRYKVLRTLQLCSGLTSLVTKAISQPDLRLPELYTPRTLHRRAIGSEMIRIRHSRATVVMLVHRRAFHLRTFVSWSGYSICRAYWLGGSLLLHQLHDPSDLSTTKPQFTEEHCSLHGFGGFRRCDQLERFCLDAVDERDSTLPTIPSPHCKLHELHSSSDYRCCVVLCVELGIYARTRSGTESVEAATLGDAEHTNRS